MKIPTLQNVYDAATTEAVSDSYPYGSLRCTAKWWIENNGKKGMRACFQTVNPKNGRVNAPKKSTYDLVKVLFINKENGHVEHDSIGFYDSSKIEAFMEKYELREQDVKLLTAAKRALDAYNERYKKATWVITEGKTSVLIG